ncbi:MAG TPA: hypothetical protein EYP04_09695, partial [Anaerolineae bacterium]|nr:hypothetical protein [Anaerolineae bacterium]
MLALILWWFFIQLMALATLPLAWRFFAALPDRGYGLAKPLGLLLTSYVFWLGASTGLLLNTVGSGVFGLLLVATFSAWLGRDGLRRDDDGRRPLLRWLTGQWRLLLVTELLFAIALAGWGFFRAHNPDITGTEKPMELMFLNGVLRSPRFPPLDPWLSGYAISYYYFGYLMLALLTRLSGVPAAVGFNVGVATWFALTVVAAFSVAYNLGASLPHTPPLAEGDGKGKSGRSQRRAELGFERNEKLGWLTGGLGVLFLAIMGNLEGLLDSLHTKGIGSQSFWDWLDVRDLAQASVTSRWVPSDFWWWFRAARVVKDRDLLGNPVEVIDEFPQFSFVLGDMHPHVLALPFVILAIGFALNLILEWGIGNREWRMGNQESEVRPS